MCRTAGLGKLHRSVWRFGQRQVRAVLVDEAGQDIRGRDLACVRQRVDDVGCAQEAAAAKLRTVFALRKLIGPEPTLALVAIAAAQLP